MLKTIPPYGEPNQTPHTPTSRQSSLPIGRPTQGVNSASRRPSDRAFSSGAPISSFSPFPRPPTAVPAQSTVHGTPYNPKKRILRNTISIDEFPKPPSGAPLSPSAESVSSFDNTPVSSRQTSDRHASRFGVGAKDGISSRSSRSQLVPQSSSNSLNRGRTSLGAPTYASPNKISAAPTELPTRSSPKEAAPEEQANVVISVRVRPDGDILEETASSADNWYTDGKSNTISYQGREGGEYIYDNVFESHDQNSKVYNSSAKRLVRRVMEGYHGTVFAYGMTGSGKTFSMQGTASSPGIIPLAITDIFSFIRETPQREFLLRVSYLEIYNEKINDLLASTPIKGQKEEEIRLREDSRRGVYATPLKEEIVQSPTQLLRVIARGDHRRRTSSTQYNVRSSRSHAVVQIVVESRERNVVPGVPTNKSHSAILPGGVRISTLSLIDLAGSERAADTKERRTEGGHINKSLLTLGTVISKLSATKQEQDKDSKHIPYRDSKLTRLLQGALSGESLISILCTVQLAGNTIETLNTLKFAARARNNIVSHAKQAQEGYNANDTGSRALLEMYRSEIVELRKQLDAQKTESQRLRDEEEEKAREAEAEARHEEHMLEMQLMRTSLKERIDHLNKLILSSKSAGVNAKKSGAYGTASKRYSNGSIVSSVNSRRSTRQSSTSTLSRLDSDGNDSIGRASSSGLEQYNEEAGEYSEEDVFQDEEKATLRAQLDKVQAELMNKDQYIATLEERLSRARRTSRSRGRTKSSELLRDGAKGWETVIEEKDAEIVELKEKLEDKDRMLTALRNVVKKREIAEYSITVPPNATIVRSVSNGSLGSTNRYNSLQSTNSSDPVPPLPQGSISDLLARRRAAALETLRSRNVSNNSTTDITADGLGHTRSFTASTTTYTPAATSPATTPHTPRTPPSQTNTFFSTRRASISSDEGRIPPSTSMTSPAPHSTSSRPSSRNKSHKRSFSSSKPIPLTLASEYPASPPPHPSAMTSDSPLIPNTPPPPPKSEKRSSRQNVAGSDTQSSPELYKAQMVRQSPSRNRMVVGVPIRTGAVENKRSLVDVSVRNGRGQGQADVVEAKGRTNSLRAEIVGQHAF